MQNNPNRDATRLLIRTLEYLASGVFGALAGAILLSALGLLVLLLIIPFIAPSWTAAVFVLYAGPVVAVVGALLGAWWWLRQAHDHQPFEHLGLMGAGLGPVLLTVACALGSFTPPSTAQLLLAIPIGFGIGGRLANRSSLSTWLLIGTLSLFVLVVLPALPDGGRLLALVFLVIVSLVVWVRSPDY